MEGKVYPGALGPFEDLAKVEDVWVDVLGRNPYGAVRAGWMRLLAPCLPATSKVSEERGLVMTKFIVNIQGADPLSDDILDWDDPANYKMKPIEGKNFYFVALAFSLTCGLSNLGEKGNWASPAIVCWGLEERHFDGGVSESRTCILYRRLCQ